ncbi:MAG: hypothetical protein ABJF10_02080 [Chthoniobacter sp.]|uniref:hypothetical protein n=1 Tax=Chthoniobacter sp. TaxID=2510640 RepID=UPI0032A53CD9
MIPLAIQAVELNAPQRATLAEWQAELGKLVQHQRTCRARAVHGSLGIHLSSAIRGAHEAIAEVGAPAMAQLLTTAAESISHYFRHAGDARQAAAQFPAFVELRGFLRGYKGEDSLAGLADQAEATGQLIARILEGGEVWRFTGGER